MPSGRKVGTGHLPAVTERGACAPPRHHLQWGPHNVMASYDYVHFTDEETGSARSWGTDLVRDRTAVCNQVRRLLGKERDPVLCVQWCWLGSRLLPVCGRGVALAEGRAGSASCPPPGVSAATDRQPHRFPGVFQRVVLSRLQACSRFTCERKVRDGWKAAR